MARIKFYDIVVKYVVTAECTQPLRIGSVSGDTEEVLVHPTDDRPFIQASGISGIFRNYCEQMYGEDWADTIFGKRTFEDSMNSYEYSSKICFTDGVLDSNSKNVKLELRPRVSIDSQMGVVSTDGSEQQSGQKFNMAYISAGAKFSFSVYLYDEQQQEKIESVFRAIDEGVIQFGGQKSNGCGYFRITSLLRKIFCLKNEKDRELWFDEDSIIPGEYENLTNNIKLYSHKQNAFDIVVEAQTENELLIKSIAVSKFNGEQLNSENIKNGKMEYIIPGSSMKEAVRSQAEKIAFYLGKQYDWNPEIVIENAFGSKKDTLQKNQNGKRGNIYFLDTVVENRNKDDDLTISHRIHIDKFTGGVMHGGLFTEKNAAGKLNFHITIRNWEGNNAEQSCGLLLMTLRDLAIGAFTIGSGYSIGRGVIKVDKITVTEQGDQKKCAVIDFSQNRIQDETEIITRCFKALQEV